MSDGDVNKMEEVEEESSKGIGLLSAAIGVITEPSETFKGLAAKPPRILASYLVVLILGVVGYALTIPTVTSEALIRGSIESRLEDANVTIPEEDLDRQVEIGRTIGAVSGLIVAVVLIFIITLIVVGIIQFVAQFLGGLGGFKQVFAVVCFAGIPNALGGIIKGFLLLTTDTSGLDMTDLQAVQEALSPQISLAIFVSRDQLFLWTLFSTIDPFLIWSLVLTAIGVSVVHRVSMRKAGIISALIWVGTVGLSFLSNLLTNRAIS